MSAVDKMKSSLRRMSIPNTTHTHTVDKMKSSLRKMSIPNTTHTHTVDKMKSSVRRTSIFRPPSRLKKSNLKDSRMWHKNVMHNQHDWKLVEKKKLGKNIKLADLEKNWDHLEMLFLHLDLIACMENPHPVLESFMRKCLESNDHEVLGIEADVFDFTSREDRPHLNRALSAGKVTNLRIAASFKRASLPPASNVEPAPVNTVAYKRASEPCMEQTAGEKGKGRRNSTLHLHNKPLFLVLLETKEQLPQLANDLLRRECAVLTFMDILYEGFKVEVFHGDGRDGHVGKPARLHWAFRRFWDEQHRRFVEEREIGRQLSEHKYLRCDGFEVSISSLEVAETRNGFRLLPSIMLRGTNKNKFIEVYAFSIRQHNLLLASLQLLQSTVDDLNLSNKFKTHRSAKHLENYCYEDLEGVL